MCINLFGFKRDVTTQLKWNHDPQHNDTQHEGIICDIQHKNTQHYNTAIMLNAVMLCVTVY